MTSLVLRKVRSGKMAKLKGIPVVLGPISEGVLKLERVQTICSACGQQVEAADKKENPPKELVTASVVKI